MCECICVRLHVCGRVCVGEFIYMCVCIGMCICMYVYVGVYMWVCICVCVYVCVYMCILIVFIYYQFNFNSHLYYLFYDIEINNSFTINQYIYSLLVII